MPFKQDYLSAVGVTPSTYADESSAVQRVSDLYQTARTGRLGKVLSSQLWTTFFSPLVPRLAELPVTQPLYDALARRHMLNLAALLRHHGRGDFGHAQKMFNLFVKDHWALNVFSVVSTEPLLHLPLDRIVLSKLGTIPAPWTAWTHVRVTPGTRDHVLTTYSNIQATFRAYWERIAPRFASPLEMEQFIWHQI